MDIVVQKYGGSSVKDLEKIKEVAKRIKERKQTGVKLVVVVSAMGNTTDKLLSMAYGLSDNPRPRELDVLMSTGEQVSIALLSIALNDIGCKARSFTGQQIGLMTEGFHTKSKISDIDASVIYEELDKDNVVIVAGFQGINNNNEITTLGRGGSDTTAVALAAKLGALCEIYTDVDGIYTIDPGLYPAARKLEYISYEEMMEMASLGAGVMHPRSIEIGHNYKVPIYVALNTGDRPGTFIRESDEIMEKTVITGLAVDNNDAMVTVNDFPYTVQSVAQLFKGLAEKHINVDMISQTTPVGDRISVSFTIPKNDLPAALESVKQLQEKAGPFTIETDTDIAKLSVVGMGMKTQPGVAARMFSVLAENDVKIKIITTSEIRISCTIDPKDQAKAVSALAKEFDL
ncbi:MAG: aspartate kinase [Clostridiales bacterium]|jgi:aspartate kinase|nr:aspartate kinase [Clostridiales bacterium]HOC07981.1 aspartate kinase [Bacillota bacterium]HQA47717.1 aspartate kinase [Bacillota bacterium]